MVKVVILSHPAYSLPPAPHNHKLGQNPSFTQFVLDVLALSSTTFVHIQIHPELFKGKICLLKQRLNSKASYLPVGQMVELSLICLR